MRGAVRIGSDCMLEVRRQQHCGYHDRTDHDNDCRCNDDFDIGSHHRDDHCGDNDLRC